LPANLCFFGKSKLNLLYCLGVIFLWTNANTFVSIHPGFVGRSFSKVAFNWLAIGLIGFCQISNEFDPQKSKGRKKGEFQMKRFHVFNAIGASVLAATLAIATSMPANAQTDTTTNTTTATEDAGDRDFDWGWLGLLGLAGLAGLARKPEEPARYRDPNEVSSTTTRY
jgi:MYXO-CTERM domain-containing protein